MLARLRAGAAAGSRHGPGIRAPSCRPLPSPQLFFVRRETGRARGGAVKARAERALPPLAGMRPSVRLLALLVALVGAAACKKSAPPARPPPPVRVVAVEPRDVEQTYEWLATLDGSTNADIRAQVTGTIVAVNYQEGTVVHDGDPLFTIDKRPFVAAVQRAVGDYQAAVAQLAKARADVARYTPLVAQHALSVEQLANARAAVDIGIGNVQAAKGALATARLDLEWTDVRAPITGLSGIAQTRVGNLVNPNLVLTTVSTLDPIRASFSISEREYLARAELINNANDPTYANRRYFELVLMDGRVFPQRARRVIVNRQIDPSTGTLLIQALFPNPGNILRPGLFAKMRLHTGLERNVLVAPERAVQQLQGTYRVAVVDPDQRVRIQPITVGPLIDHDYVIESGLKPGERVIVDGQQNAQPGTLVQAEPAPPGATLGAASPPPAPDPAPSRQARTPPPAGGGP